MKYVFTLLFIAFVCTCGRAQDMPMVKGTGLPHYQGIPTHTPTTRGPEVAWVMDSLTWYYYDITETEWKKLRTGSTVPGTATQAVTSDATLRGDGTSNAPLRVDTANVIATRTYVATQILANSLRSNEISPTATVSSVSIGYQVDTSRPEFVYRNGQLLKQGLAYTRAGTTYFFTISLRSGETIRIVNYAQ